MHFGVLLSFDERQDVVSVSGHQITATLVYSLLVLSRQPQGEDLTTNPAVKLSPIWKSKAVSQIASDSLLLPAHFIFIFYFLTMINHHVAFCTPQIKVCFDSSTEGIVLAMHPLIKGNPEKLYFTSKELGEMTSAHLSLQEIHLLRELLNLDEVSYPGEKHK